MHAALWRKGIALEPFGNQKSFFIIIIITKGIAQEVINSNGKAEENADCHSDKKNKEYVHMVKSSGILPVLNIFHKFIMCLSMRKS